MMYSLLNRILADKKGGEVFMLFSGWHFFYVVLTVALIVTALILLRSKTQAVRERVARGFGSLAFGLYIADIFLMPLAYGEIDIEKLPFHVCTATCLMCFLSSRSTRLEKYRLSFVLLGFISNLVYLIYPAGVMWHAVHPLSYRVVQTLLFHGIMTVYGALTLAFEHQKLEIKHCYRDLTVVVLMTVWALLGNYAYNGISEGYSHFFNWFFVVRDPFYAIPETVAPFVMPILNIVLFFAVEMAIRLAVRCVKRIKDGR